MLVCIISAVMSWLTTQAIFIYLNKAVFSRVSLNYLISFRLDPSGNPSSREESRSTQATLWCFLKEVNNIHAVIHSASGIKIA